MPEPYAYCHSQTFGVLPDRVAVFPAHYLLYASSGSMRLTVEEGSWTLPPARAALIPAGQPIRHAVARGMECCSVLFRPDTMQVTRTTVFPVPPLLRDMMLYSRRWNRDAAGEPEAEPFFRAIAGLLREAAAQPGPSLVPQGKSTAVQTAIRITQDRLTEPLRFEDIAAAVHCSPRALSRRFAAETGLSWGRVLQRIRMAHAAELLVQDGLGVAEAAFACGYASVSAFSLAFRDFTGHAPAAFRAAQRGS